MEPVQSIDRFSQIHELTLDARHCTLLLSCRKSQLARPKLPGMRRANMLRSRLLLKVLSVPHSEIKAQLDAEKRVRKQRKKRPSDHASGSKV